MGGGDLNMKKSWHPALMKNQEQVWLKEKEALEEKKKLAQLRKEKEEERQMQELQRLQEEQTGRKRTERLDWMYATPASGSTANANDLEEYLLGKKRVDKMLIGDEHAKLGAAHKDFIAVQNANTQRDILSKIREDPLLAIKQQEQAAYQALMSNPLRIKELKEKSGLSKKERKEKRKEEKDKKRKRSRSRSPRRRSASPPPRRRDDDDGHSHSHRRRSDSRGRSPDPERHRSSRRDYDRDRDRDYRRRSRSRSHERRRDRRSASPPRRRDDRGRADSSRRSSEEDHLRRPPTPPPAGPPVHPSRMAFIQGASSSRPPPPSRPAPSQADTDRAARLAAMSSSASDLAVEREKRLAELRAREQEELAREEAARLKSFKHGGVGSFLEKEKARALMGSEGNLEERIRRNRGALVGID